MVVMVRRWQTPGAGDNKCYSLVSVFNVLASCIDYIINLLFVWTWRDKTRGAPFSTLMIDARHFVACLLQPPKQSLVYRGKQINVHSPQTLLFG